MSVLRVLHVIDSLAPAGAETSLVTSFAPLRALGVHVDTVALKPHPTSLSDDLRDQGATVHEFDDRSLAAATRSVVDLMRREQYDVLHSSLFRADMVARLAGVAMPRLSVTATLTGMRHTARHLPALKRAGPQVLDAISARRCSRLHAVSHQVADEMSRRLRYPRARVHVIPRGRDQRVLGRVTSERRERTRSMLGALKGERLILAVARHEPVKGLDVLLESLPDILASEPRARLLVAGAAGSATSRLQEIVHRHQLSDVVRFAGARNDVPDLLCACDVFVLSSRSEGSPGALIEAMALRAPIVASDLPAVREVVDPAMIDVAATGDPVDLAAAVERALTRPVKATEQRTEAVHARYLAEFTAARVASRMANFYKLLIRDPRR